MWKGSAAISINSEKMLMVLQGKKDEPKLWSILSGEKIQEKHMRNVALEK